MNEINVNALSRAAGIDKPQDSVVKQKGLSNGQAVAGEDSVQFSKLPDVSDVEQSLEHEFEARRSSLVEKADSSEYPPIQTIDRLAAMLAIKLDPEHGGPTE